jgi:phenylacetate-CoA ligase
MSITVEASVERLPAAELRQLQYQRLLAQLERLSGSSSPYWSGKLVGVQLGRIRGLEDITELPFTMKSDLRDSFPFGMLAVPREDTVRVHASSGTRGKPTVVAYTEADVRIFAEVNARTIACAGGRREDVLHVAYGYGLFTGGLGLHFGGERLGATVVPASGGNPSFQVQLMADLGAHGLACTPSFAMLLAEQAEADGLMSSIRRTLRYGVFGAEPWSDSFRTKLEQAWGGIDACDVYGLSEVIGPGVACECREGKGGLHVNEDHFFPEILVAGGDQPVAPGQLGELVLTTLTKEAQPVLRYRTGDITTWIEGPCPCGRTLRRVARFSGRVDDMVVARGVNVYPSEIEAVLLEDDAVAGQYVVLLDHRPTMPELVVCAELAADRPLDSRAEIAARLRARLARRLRLRVETRVLPPGGIPRQETGKAKRVFDVESNDDPRAALIDGPAAPAAALR